MWFFHINFPIEMFFQIMNHYAKELLSSMTTAHINDIISSIKK